MVLKVLLVAPSFPPHLGGIETVTAELAQALTVQGAQVAVYTQARGVDTDSIDPHDRPYQVHWYPDAIASERFPVSPRLWLAVRTHAPEFDVVHLHDVNSFATLAACSTRDVPLVLSPYFHGPGHSSLTRLLHLAYDPLLKLALRRLSRVICISRAEATAFGNAYPRLMSRVSYAHIAVDSQALQSAPPRAVGRPVILAAGRFVAYKQFDLIIRAFARLDRSRVLVLLGLGEEETHLRQLVADLGLSPSDVMFAGRASEDELRSWYATADLFVSMSRHESFGLALLQAIVSGVPSIASAIPAHAELQQYAVAPLTLVPADVSPAELSLVLAAPGPGRVPVPPDAGMPTWDSFARKVLKTYEQAVSPT